MTDNEIFTAMQDLAAKIREEDVDFLFGIHTNDNYSFCCNTSLNETIKVVSLFLSRAIMGVERDSDDDRKTLLNYSIEEIKSSTLAAFACLENAMANKGKEDDSNEA